MSNNYNTWIGNNQNCRYTYVVSYLNRLFSQLNGAILFTRLALELLLGWTPPITPPTFLTQMEKEKKYPREEKKKRISLYCSMKLKPLPCRSKRSGNYCRRDCQVTKISYDTVWIVRDGPDWPFLCNFPLICLIFASTLAVKPIFVFCLAFDRSLFHIVWSSTSFFRYLISWITWWSSGLHDLW